MAAHRATDDRNEQNDDVEDSEVSGRSDNDSEFDEDMESLRRACMLTGTDLLNPSSAASPSGSDSDHVTDEVDDFELQRRICQPFSIPDAEFEHPRAEDFKPIRVVPPDDSDDGEEDIATLLAV